MDITLFLNKEFADAFHERAIPHVGEHAKTYVQIAQSIAMVDQVLETPYFEQCVEQCKEMDPYGSIEMDFFEESPYVVALKELHSHIEKEKRSLIRTFQTVLKTDPTHLVEKIQEKINAFHEKKDILCTGMLHALEFIVEKQRLDKIMTSLPSFVPS